MSFNKIKYTLEEAIFRDFKNGKALKSLLLTLKMYKSPIQIIRKKKKKSSMVFFRPLRTSPPVLGQHRP